MDGGSCPGVGVLTRKINDFVESCNAQARSFVRVAADPAWPRSIQPSQDPTPLYFFVLSPGPCTGKAQPYGAELDAGQLADTDTAGAETVAVGKWTPLLPANQSILAQKLRSERRPNGRLNGPGFQR